MRFHVSFLVCTALLSGPLPSTAAERSLVEQIMEEVAANQDRAQELRREFVYRQEVIIRFTRGNGRLAREELRELQVTPTPEQTEKTLLRFLGKYEKDGKLLEYSEPRFRHKELDLDGEIISELAEEFTNDKKSRDGIARDFFPLTSREQSKYRFNLKGEEVHRDRPVYRIAFEPRGKGWEEMESAPWSGELLVDRTEYQPVLVTTRLAKDIPLAVRVLLGTDVQRLGFKVAYEKFGEGIWFPVSYGGEFKLKAVFFYKRKIAIALNNGNFQRTAVSTRLVFNDLLEISQPLKLPEMPPRVLRAETR
jgi:hypothetical protein